MTNIVEITTAVSRYLCSLLRELRYTVTFMKEIKVIRQIFVSFVPRVACVTLVGLYLLLSYFDSKVSTPVSSLLASSALLTYTHVSQGRKDLEKTSTATKTRSIIYESWCVGRMEVMSSIRLQDERYCCFFSCFLFSTSLYIRWKEDQRAKCNYIEWLKSAVDKTNTHAAANHINHSDENILFLFLKWKTLKTSQAST